MGKPKQDKNLRRAFAKEVIKVMKKQEKEDKISTSEKKNYVSKPPTFSGNSTEFGWWKSKMYTHIKGLDDELWDILEDGIVFAIDEVGTMADRKSLTPTQKNIYRKPYRVRRFLIDNLPHSEYLKILEKSTAKTIFKSLRASYEGNQQVKETKENILVQ
ncbi:unnamed protein product [Vicia faba]|uniref:Uncharacterized protein n=1 Tax=Vicia faba TaxID=3906 RepID=A0AAV0ZJG4_VICFA|nr:unnamed protein product [Vicia faba]